MNNTLTLKEAVDKHRQLWNWIADETKKIKKPASKHANPMVQEDHPDNDCYMCEYVGKSSCENCPLQWGNKQQGCCDNHSSPYYRWVREKNLMTFSDASNLARQIANLPLKPECQKMYDEEIDQEDQKG